MTIWQRIAGAAVDGTEAASTWFRNTVGGIGTPSPSDATHSVTFTIAIIALMAKMARSDGAVTTDEVVAFARVCRFPESEAANVRRLFDLAKQDVAGFESYARRIHDLLANEPVLRRDVLEGLFVVAAADGVLHELEERYLRTVAELLAIKDAEFQYIRSLFVRDVATPYEILGMKPDATDDELKRRHRHLVLENHPDKLIARGVPPEFMRIAEQKLAAINAAFDRVAKERGL